MGEDFVYVSGRKRAVGEMNGKSSNLNNCLGQIYPPGIPIPPNELVCIFDADQVSTRLRCHRRRTMPALHNIAGLQDDRCGRSICEVEFACLGVESGKWL